MATLKRTMFEMLIVGGLACGLAFGTNAMREKGRLDLGKAYFDKGPGRPAQAADADERSVAAPGTTDDSQTTPAAEMSQHLASSAATTALHPASRASIDPPQASTEHEITASSPRPALKDPQADPKGDDESFDEDAHIEHEYQDIHTAEVVELFNDTNTAYGVNLFIDARSDDAFAEGHIPGAIQVHAYEISRYLTDDILSRIESAEKVVVYCNGGNCEDSIFLCRDLIYEFDVPFDKVYLYGGGWKAWTKRGMPVENTE